MAGIGEALFKSGLVTKEHLRLALERQVVFGGRVGTNLVELGILKEDEFLKFLSGFHKVPMVDPATLMNIDAEVLASINAKTAEKYKVLPFKKDKNRLLVAMLDPKNFQAIQELSFITGFDIVPHVVSELRLLYCMERAYGLKRDLRFISILDRPDETAAKKPEDKEEMMAEHLAKVKEQFASVTDREEVAGLLLTESRRVAKRAALFIIKGHEIAGWSGKGIDVQGFKTDAAPESIFGDVIARKAYYRGPLLQVGANSEFIELIGNAPADCILIPVFIRDRITCMLYADNVRDVLDSNINYISKLTNIASLAFEIIIVRKKIQES